MLQMSAKDSFERFGDDLSQLLLSYMSPEDRFKYEGVSKQWQRLIFKTLSHISLYCQSEGDLETALHLNTTEMAIKSIEVVLKKCSNITRIDLEEMERLANGPLIELIIRYCPQLSDIRMKCNDKLTVDDKNSIRRLLATFRQLVTIGLNINYRCNSFDLLSINSNVVLYPKISKLSFIYFKKESNDFKKFVDIYGKQLKAIDVTIHTHNEEAIGQLMSYLSQIQTLIALKIEFSMSPFGGKSLNAITIGHMDQIGYNCRQLKSLSLRAAMESENWQPLIEMINQHFNQLRRLDVLVILRFNESVSLNNQSLSECKRLTHLKIESSVINTVEFMANISQLFPKLQVFSLLNFGMNITDAYFYALAELPKIRDVTLYGGTERQYTDAAVNHLKARNCKIDFYDE